MSTTFLLTAFVVVLAPGPGVAWTVATTLKDGARAGALAAVACTTGLVVHLAVAALVLSGLVEVRPEALAALRWVGVGYLAWLGVQLWRAPTPALADDGDGATAPQDLVTVVRTALLINVLNPKLVLFFLALLPPFLEPPVAPLDPRLIAMSGAFMGITLVVFVGYVLLASVLRNRLSGSRRGPRRVQQALGGVLVLFAARLAVSA